jgi:hypothetical protein
MTPADSSAGETPELLKRLSHYERADSQRGPGDGPQISRFSKDEYLSRLQALERLAKLRAAGLLTDAEFELARTKIMGRAETQKSAAVPSAWVWSQFRLGEPTDTKDDKPAQD